MGTYWSFPVGELPFCQAVFIAKDRIEVGCTQPGGQLMEFRFVDWVAVMQVRGFGDQAKLRHQRDAIVSEHATKRLKVAGVYEQELMFIQLHFDATRGRYDGDARTSVIQEQVLKVTEVTHQDRQVDVATAKVAVSIALPAVTGLKDRVSPRAKRFEKIQKDIE